MNATGVRVHVHSRLRRRYLAAVIAPLARELADRPEPPARIHLATGWRFGPHFDLRADARPGHPVDWQAIGGALAEGAAGFPIGVSEAEYLRTATLLGRIEAVPPPYLPRHPHGHTELLAPDDSPVWQGRLGLLRARGLAHLLAPLIDAAGAGSEGAVLARVAEAFLALAATHPHGLRFGTFSFRSHAEAFFHWAAPAADYRTAFDNRMGKDRAVLEELVRRIRDGRPGAPAAEWQRAFHACMSEFAGQVTDHDLDRAAPPGAAPSRPREDRREDRRENPREGPREGQSAFHAAVAASGVIDESPQWFAGYRLTINLFYELLPALDISPVRRFYLCHAIAQCVDAVFGETWETRLAAVEAHLAGSR
ncbi:MAG: hypothetical protein QOJ52_2617 [Acidimicrobiaceae bacterium]|jgi:hypothetical protein|nr:hypothetical protein [Acidimicrobiaceae bacterium]